MPETQMISANIPLRNKEHTQIFPPDGNLFLQKEVDILIIPLWNKENAQIYPPHSNPLLQKEVDLLMQIKDMQDNGAKPPFTPYLTKKQQQQLKRDVYLTRSKGIPSPTHQ